MIVTTNENIPGRNYEIISFVCANRKFSMFAKTRIYKVKNKLIKEAEQIRADAIVSVSVFSTKYGGTAMYGTAVRFI